MSSLREEAEFLRIAIAMGLLDTAEAVAWADRTMMELDTLPLELIEVSLGGKLPADEMMRLLALVPGPGDLTAGAHRALGILRERLEAGAVTLETAIDLLGRYENVAIISEDERVEAINHEDALYLAQVGYYGSYGDVREELIAFLDYYSLRSMPAEPTTEAK